MLFDIELFDRAACTREEKAGTLSLIDLMLDMADQARREGLLSLESRPVPDELCRWGISMIIKGLSPEKSTERMLTRILAEGRRGRALLEGMIVIDGLMMVQSGTNPSEVYQKLTFYLGTDSDLADMWREGDELCME